MYMCVCLDMTIGVTRMIEPTLGPKMLKDWIIKLLQKRGGYMIRSDMFLPSSVELLASEEKSLHNALFLDVRNKTKVLA